MLAGLHPTFNGAVILLHDVIEVTPDSVPAVFRQCTLVF
jgi:hypothetical protein